MTWPPADMPGGGYTNGTVSKDVLPDFMNGAITQMAALQPLDSDLTAIAALSTTTFGRSLLALADAAAGRTALALGTAATQASTAFDSAGAAAGAAAASQPLDSDLTAIAALSTTSYGRAFLALADAAAGRTALGLGTAATTATTDYAALADPTQQFTSPADTGSKIGVFGVPGRGPRPMMPPSRVVTRFPSGHGWTGGVDDLTTTLFTDRTYKMTTAGAGSYVYAGFNVAFTSQDWSSSIIRVIVKVDNAARLNTLDVLAYTTASDVFAGSIQTNPISGDWIIATINRSQLSVAAGSPSWSTITNVNIRIADNSGGAVNVWLGAVELIPDQAAIYPSGVFILEMDDGYSGQKANLVPVVGQRGIPVTFNPIIDRITGGTAGITVADMKLWQNVHGWQIGNHAYAGTFHDSNPGTSTAADADFLKNKHWLHANGFHTGADDYSECPGTGSPIAEGAMLDELRKNFRSARVNSGFYETAVVGDPYKFRSILFTGNTNANLHTNIDAVAGAGGALIFTVHDVLTGSTNGTSNSLPAMAANNLANVLDYAITKGMVFRTRGDWLERR